MQTFSNISIGRDAGDAAIQAPSKFQYETISGLKSPQSITAATAFGAPSTALFFVFRSDSPITYSDSARIANGYESAPANEITAVPVIGGQVVYVAPASGTSNVSFHFELGNPVN